MKGSHAVAGIAAAVVLAGVGAAFVARLTSGAAAALGPIPAEALAFPAETRLLAGLDLARLRDSPLFERYAPLLARALPMDALGPIAERAGLDLHRDLDHMVLAWLPASGGETAGLALVRGRLDGLAGRLDEAGLARRELPGARSWAVGEAGGVAVALALLDGGAALVGSAAAVEGTVERLAREQTALRDNRALADLAEELGGAGGSLWLIGDGTLLAQLPVVLGSAGEGLAASLPPLHGLALSAEASPQLAIDAVARARDEAGARLLAGTLRGVLALASLQASRTPELGEAAAAVSVSTDGLRVRIGARLRPELLESFARMSPAGAGARERAQ